MYLSSDKQKNRYRDQLKNGTFIFDSTAWHNCFQLEAVVEHYANQGRVNFLNPVGEAAQIQGLYIVLDGFTDLSRIRPGYDTLSLAGFDRRFLIESINHEARRITVIDPPEVSGTVAWTIHLRPQIILIDPFGARLSGSMAANLSNATIQLDSYENLKHVNPYFDSIYLEADSRSYQIIGVDMDNDQVTVAGNPQFEGVSRWRIPAGLGGELPELDYDLGPGHTRGWDHYDGMLFVVADDAVKGHFRWSSYTSRNYQQPHRFLSSIRGNNRYRLASCRAGTVKNINYGFCVYNAQPPDEPLDAYFYFDPEVKPDVNIRQPFITPGKTDVMMHIGWTQVGQAASGDGTGSAGCLVSPHFYAFRDLMIDLYQADYFATHGAIDPMIQPLVGLDHAGSVDLWVNSQPESQAAVQVSNADWENKIQADLWLIRPGEVGL